MSNISQHPAFYITRRQLWDKAPGPRNKWYARWINRSVIGSNLNSLFDIWNVMFICGATTWLLCSAIQRYNDFKQQVANPRFGNEWNDSLTLNTQLFSIIMALSLFPIAIYAAICQTGHLANDSVMLGNDVIDLRKRFCSAVSIPHSWKSMTNDSSVNLQPIIREDTELELLLFKKHNNDLTKKIYRYFRPFSSVIFVLMTYAFLFPICVLEAEQLRNEVIHPSYVLQSPLDGIFGVSSMTADLSKSQFLTREAELEAAASDRAFSSHNYPTKPKQVSLEFVMFVCASCIFIVRVASIFYFTSRRFSILLSTYSLLSLALILIDAATISTLYKLAINGVREPGGRVFVEVGPIDPVITPFQCLIIGAVGLPAVLLNIMTAYAYGEDQFDGAVVNYAQLLITNELPSPIPSALNSCHNKINCNGDLLNGNLVEQDNCQQNTAHFNYSPRDAEIALPMPMTIAVTTKLWRPPPSVNKRNGRLLNRNTSTPLPGQYTSNCSENSSTIKRPRVTGSADISGSMPSIADTSETVKNDVVKRSNYGLLVLAFLSYLLLLSTRICLTGPILKCYWKFGLRLALFDIIFTVFYLIFSMLFWFGLGVKKAWRFRMIHVLTPFDQKLSETYPMTNLPNGFSQHPPHPGFLSFWPYVPYTSWTANGQTAALPSIDPNAIESLHNPNGDALAEVESGRDSLYGCFADVGQATGSNMAIEHYQQHVPKLNLQTGPPTLSDESDGLSNSVDRCHEVPSYFKPLANNDRAEYRPMSRQSCNPTPVNSHLVGEHPKFGAAIPSANVVRARGQVVGSSQSMLFNDGAKIRSTDNSDPTYATLATLARQTRYRSPSVNSHLRDPSPAARNTAFHRRNGSRVTFREGIPCAYGTTHDGATGSSDSGVYTNGNGTSHAEYHTKCSEENYLLGIKNYSNPRSPDTRRIGDDVELSTDMTSVGVNGNRNTIYTKKIENSLGNSNDQLCSQV